MKVHANAARVVSGCLCLGHAGRADKAGPNL